MAKLRQHKSELFGWAYVRVSTPDQGNVLHGSLEQQLNRIKRWQSEQSKKSGIKHTITKFIDEDISGRAKSLHRRREYHSLIRAIERNEIDFVVVEKLDRLHRDIVESRKFIDLCDIKGITLYRLDGGKVDLKDRSSRTSVFIESWMAEEYSLDLVEKLTKKGREARVNNGKDTNSMPVLGLDNHPTEACFYEINLEEQKIVKDIFNYFCSCGDLKKTADYCEQKGYRTKIRKTKEKIEKGKKIAPQLVGGKLFDRKSVRALLVSRKIAGFGFFYDDWNQFPSLQDEKGMVRWEYRHGPVVSSKLFEKTQALLRKNNKFNYRNYQNQRTYILSGVLFDQEGNKFRGESAKSKNNFYYLNPKKKFRIPAEKVEKSITKVLSNIIKDSGLLDSAIKRVFAGENTVVDRIDKEIESRKKQQKQCEHVLDILAQKRRIGILENPEMIDEILLESIKLKKESESQLQKINKDIDSLAKKRAELIKFKDKDEITLRIKKALRAFDKSSSLHKKQLIQMMVPKAVIDEKNDELALFLNPFVEKSFNSKDLELNEAKPILTLNAKNSGDSFLGEIENSQVPSDFALSQSKEKVRVAEEWRFIPVAKRTIQSSTLCARQYPICAYLTLIRQDCSPSEICA